MFPESSGVYIAKRESEILIVRIKGMFPTLTLDKKALDLGSFLRTGKVEEVSKDTLDNIELFNEYWTFHPLKHIGFDVFSKIEFIPDSSRLYVSEEDMIALRGKYYRMCQQGVSPTKIIRALTYEFKTTPDQIIELVNKFDGQSYNIN